MNETRFTNIERASNTMYVDSGGAGRQHPCAMPSVSKPTPNDPNRPAVLVIDDNRDVADAFAAVLEIAGYSVTALVSVREALDALDNDATIGTVISDVRMPELDGFDFLRVVKHRFPHMRVFLVTGQEVTQ